MPLLKTCPTENMAPVQKDISHALFAGAKQKTNLENKINAHFSRTDEVKYGIYTMECQTPKSLGQSIMSWFGHISVLYLRESKVQRCKCDAMLFMWTILTEVFVSVLWSSDRCARSVSSVLFHATWPLRLAFCWKTLQCHQFWSKQTS